MRLLRQSSRSSRSNGSSWSFAVVGITCGVLVACEPSPDGRSTISHAPGPVLPTNMSLDAVRDVCQEVADSAGWQRGPIILTFATEWDCARCSGHIGAMARMISDLGHQDRSLLVVWAGNPRRVPGLVASALSSAVDAPEDWPGRICIDARGKLWDGTILMATPLTAVAVHGRVRTSTNAPLSSEEQRVSFQASIQAAVQRQ